MLEPGPRRGDDRTMGKGRARTLRASRVSLRLRNPARLDCRGRTRIGSRVTGSGRESAMKTNLKTETQDAASAGRTTTSGAPARPMREDDLLRFVWDADPQISPDGQRVAFTRVWVDAEADEYRTQVWLAEPGRAARPWSSGRYDAQPRWSPDGRWLAFVRKSESGK